MLSSHKSSSTTVVAKDTEDDSIGRVGALEQSVSSSSVMKKRKKKGWTDPTPNSGSNNTGSNIRQGINIKRKQYNDLKAKFDQKKEALKKLNSKFVLKGLALSSLPSSHAKLPLPLPWRAVFMI